MERRQRLLQGKNIHSQIKYQPDEIKEIKYKIPFANDPTKLDKTVGQPLKYEPKTYKVLEVAMSGYGKTQLAIEYLKELINSKELEACRLVIFSQTIKSDRKQLDFKKWLQSKCKKGYDYDQNNTAEEIKYSFLQSLYNNQKELKDSQRQYKHWFIWFEDQIVDDNLRFGIHPILKSIAFIGRHYGISQLWNMQSYKSSIDPSIKLQITTIFLGNLNSDEKKLEILKEFSSGYCPENPKKSAEMLYQLYVEIMKTNDGHGFIRINVEKQCGQGRFQVGLNGKILDNIDKMAIKNTMNDKDNQIEMKKLY